MKVQLALDWVWIVKSEHMGPLHFDCRTAYNCVFDLIDAGVALQQLGYE